MRVNENGQYVSDDGFWVWDGAAWVPADGSATPAADTAATETGAETTAAEPAVTQEYAAVDYASDTTAATTPSSLSAWAAETTPDQGSLAGGDRVVPQVDSAHPMSPDGRHWWDGERWHDVSTDATSLATAGLDDEVPAVDTPTASESFTDHYADAQAGSQAEAEPTAAAAEVTPVGHVADVAEVAAEPAKPERQLSPDGMWEWNGTQWIPAEQAAAPVVETVAAPEPEPVKAERQLSPDGHWEWDGTAWVPAQQAAVAAVPDGAHVSPDGHWWWDGSQWLPTGR